MATPYFFTKNNLIAIIDNMAPEAIVLSGYTLLLVGGWFDLSTDGIVSLSGVITGLLINRGVPWPLAVVISLFSGGIVGAINGVTTSRFKINGLVATLTTWWICVGFTLGMTKAVTPFGFPESFQVIGQAKILGFRITVVYAIVAILFFSFLLHLKKIGAHLYLSGDNKQSCEFMGIDTGSLGIKMYTSLGLLAAFIGVITASKLNAASMSPVDGMTLKIIAAAVIGGVRLDGGKGNIIGALLGLLLMNILGNAIIQLGISPYWQKAISGGILLAVVLLDKFKNEEIKNE
jgi:ribose transport system permease protein